MLAFEQYVHLKLDRRDTVSSKSVMIHVASINKKPTVGDDDQERTATGAGTGGETTPGVIYSYPPMDERGQ